MYTRHEISEEEHKQWWSRVSGRADQQYFMYEFRGCALGIVAFNGIDTVNKNSSWAFYAAPDAPRGVGSRMEFLALDHAFQELALHKLHCEVFEFNAAVIKMHHKFGFQTEGIFREQHWLENRFVNVHRLAILGSEWTVKRDAMLETLLAKIQG